MPFYISAERAVKLVDRFKSFEADRAIVHARMEQYRPRLPRVSEAPPLREPICASCFAKTRPTCAIQSPSIPGALRRCLILPSSGNWPMPPSCSTAAPQRCRAP